MLTKQFIDLITQGLEATLSEGRVPCSASDIEIERCDDIKEHYLTDDEGLEIELSDGSVFMVTVQKKGG